VVAQRTAGENVVMGVKNAAVDNAIKVAIEAAMRV